MGDARVTIECENCGKEMEMYRSEAETARFCSRECMFEFRRHDRETRVCENCGEEYEKRPNDPHRNRFCSLECHREWQKGENHPRYIESDDLLEELRRLAGELGRVPTRDELEEYGEYAAKPYYNHFDSWVNALEEAGLKPRREQRKEAKLDNRSGRLYEQRRKEILRRDLYTCQLCGIANKDHLSEYGVGLHVHHKIHSDRFESLEEANIDLNMITLCASCHAKQHAEEKLPQFNTDE